jgi:hypothetical protein
LKEIRGVDHSLDGEDWEGWPPCEHLAVLPWHGVL